MEEYSKKSHEEKEPFRQKLECIRDSGPYVTKIFRGLQEGESAEKLLLIAIDCISKLTGDTLFYNESLENLKAIYGEALLTSGGVELKLEEIESRLTHLRAALKNDAIEKGDKERIEKAIQSNENKKEALTKSSGKS